VNGPNVLSLSRIGLTPVAAWLIANDSALAFPVIAFALFTDFLDGALARLRHESTDLGRFLDPLGDKVFAGGVVAALAASGRVPWEIAIAVLMRDGALLTYGWMRLRTGDPVPAASLPGKIAFAALGAYLLAFAAGFSFPTWVGGAVVAVYLLTGILYGARAPWILPGRVAKEPR
jgi:phosphatidylglycerophosphate synthase